MKINFRWLIMLAAGLIMAVSIAAVMHSTAVQSSQPAFDKSAAFFLQATATPQPVDQSEIGSTDGIVIMGMIIGFIITIPILARRGQWARRPTP